jgi:hypothetical protein
MECYIQNLLGVCLLLLPAPTAMVHSAFASFYLFTTQALNNIPIVTLYNYIVQYMYHINLTTDF